MRRLLALCIKILASYALFGFAVVPAIIHLSVSQFAPKVLTVPMQLGAVQFNPFTLRLSLQSIKLGETEQHLVRLSEFSVDLAWDSLLDRKLHIQSVKLVRPFADVILLESGQINLSSLIKGSDQSEAEATDKTVSNGGASVKISLDQLAIENAFIGFQDRMIEQKTGTGFTIAVKDLTIIGTDLGWPSMSGAMAVQGHLSDGSTIDLNADIVLPAMAVTAKANIQDVNLSQIQPYLTPVLYTQLSSGKLTTDFDLSWSEQQGLTLNSALDVVDLKVKDARDNSEIVGWGKLSLSGIQFVQSDNAVDIESISLVRPSLTLAIDNQLQVNLAGLVKPSESASKTEPSEASDSEAMAFSIHNISIQNGAMDFADRSFRPGFSAPINRLSGAISGVSSTSQEPATFTISGQIDRYSPVTIKGKVDISNPMANSQLKLAFDSVELTTLTPYSGRFAGYTIHKGRMDLGLDYRLNDKELTAQNSMMLEHLTLGEKIDSDEAIDLPLKLAIALLKDGDGRIDIKLPVKGDLDNPEFELGPVIRMAVINMLTNIISAPFDFLASLVGGDASEMQTVSFVQGISSIPEHQKKALNSLVDALNDRPELQLEVTGTATIKEDWPLVAEVLLEQDWQDHLEDNVSNQQGSALSEEETVNLLQAIAQKHQIEVPESKSIEDIKATVIANWPYDEGALRSLAIRRAKGIKNYLTDQGLEADRVFILDVQTPKENLAEEGTIQSKLELTSG